jgi:archaemetzincin
MRAALIAAVLCCALTQAVAQQPLPISIRPLGAVDSSVIRATSAAIERVYAFPVRVDSALPLPRSAWYAPRERYRAEKLLAYLNGLPDGHSLKVIGITASDISTTKGDIKDWGIMGLAGLDGQACVVSTFRLRKRHASDSLFYARVGKVVIHELGHTLGLPHCPVKGCIMEDAGGTIKTVDAEWGFCPACKEILGKILR